MVATDFQRGILRLLADRRRARGESYVAGGVALNQLLGAPRQSLDIDLFHDSEEALGESWREDRGLLEGAGYGVEVLREGLSFVEARICRGGQRVLMQWSRDSAFRFFPLVEDELMGLALHPFDLATNKVLAMAGRLEPRDWIDVVECDGKLQPLGFLIWAACGKDPGHNPRSLLSEASRAHYSQAELDALDFLGPAPDAAELGRRWHGILREAQGVCDLLSRGELGKCVATAQGELFRGTAGQLEPALRQGLVRYHAGRLGGAWPSFRSA